MAEHDHENCHDVLIHLSEFIDGEISDEIRKELEDHIQHCENCRIVLDTTRKTIYLYHRIKDDQTVPSAVNERLYHTLHLDEFRSEK